MKDARTLRQYDATAARHGIAQDDADTLRRAALTLHRWAELECGLSGHGYDYTIERDEDTGKPYRVTYFHTGRITRYRIADRETAALRRVYDIAARYGLTAEHQTDPRGWPLTLTAQDGRTLSVPPVSR